MRTVTNVYLDEDDREVLLRCQGLTCQALDLDGRVRQVGMYLASMCNDRVCMHDRLLTAHRLVLEARYELFPSTSPMWWSEEFAMPSDVSELLSIERQRYVDDIDKALTVLERALSMATRVPDEEAEAMAS